MADGPEKSEDLDSESVNEDKVEESSAEAEAAQLKDKLLRLTAEFDNFRKRSIREKEEYRKFAVEQVIMELLDVYDNFERAIESAKQTDDISSVITGVEMVFKQFTGILEKEGLEKIECQGREFDPHLHEAMMHVEHPDHEENTVMDVCRPGYCLHTKVIRPAMVTVSKKPEK